GKDLFAQPLGLVGQLLFGGLIIFIKGGLGLLEILEFGVGRDLFLVAFILGKHLVVGVGQEPLVFRLTFLKIFHHAVLILEDLVAAVVDAHLGELGLVIVREHFSEVESGDLRHGLGRNDPRGKRDQQQHGTKKLQNIFHGRKIKQIFKDDANLKSIDSRDRQNAHSFFENRRQRSWLDLEQEGVVGAVAEGLGGIERREICRARAADDECIAVGRVDRDIVAVIEANAAEISRVEKGGGIGVERGDKDVGGERPATQVLGQIGLD